MMRTKSLISIVSFTAFLAVGGAYAETGTAPAADTTTTTTTATATAGPSDAQIAAIAVAAHNADISAGKLAEKKAKSGAIKKFAKQMVNDHSAGKAKAVALVTKLKVTPEENDTSKSLTEGGEKNVATLKGMKGADFDKAYIDHEVEYHQSVLDAITNTLIPNAKNDQLKGLLEKTKANIEHHLQMAKDVQSSLSKG